MKQIFILVSMLISFSACEIKQNDLKPEDEFVKIYNDLDEDLTWYPVGIKQTSDKGFLILNAVKSDTSQQEFPSATIIKVNAVGEVENTVLTDWLAPSGIILTNNKYSFVAMDALTKASLISISENGETEGSSDLGINYPLSVNDDNQGGFVVLGYDNISNSSIVAQYNSSVTLINSIDFKVIDNTTTGTVLSHLNRTGSELPFFIGKWNNGNQNGFFVNCLANYTLRTVFLNNSVTALGGDIFSFQDRDALSSLINIDGNSYAFTRYYGGNNYISVNVEVDPASSQNFNDLTQNKLAELVPEAKVVAKKVVFNSNDYILFASSTNSNSIVIYQYPTDGTEEVLHTEYFDFENKIEVVDLIQDENDGGIVVLGRIFLTGRFLRPIVIKFKKDEFVN
jgi:hypothetical protein